MFGPFWNNLGYLFPYTSMQEMNLDWLIRTVKILADNYPEFSEELNKKLNKPVVNPDGFLNDILLSNGDGSTRWESLDITIGNEIQEAVDTWLDEHPEATTTVQDGTISPAKLNTELYNLYKQQGRVQFFFPPNMTGTFSQNCCLMITPKKTVMFDAGEANNRVELMTYLQSLYTAGVFTNIDYIVISHYHHDHVGNLETIVTTFPHQGCHMYIPLSPAGYYPTIQYPQLVDVHDDVVRIAVQNNISYTEVNQDTNVDIDNLTRIQLFNSDPTSYTYYSNQLGDYNNYSMVSLIKTGATFSMLPGDIQNLAQQRIYANYDLPRLFLYCVHHHGGEQGDYLPYIYKINPLYNVISTQYTGTSYASQGDMWKIVDGFVGSTGYDSYSFVTDGQSGQITHGVNLNRSGWTMATIDFYVDNSYTGSVHDGSQDHPFTTINEASIFMRANNAVQYRILVRKTATAYQTILLRNFPNQITITRWGSENPVVNGCNIEDCTIVIMSNLAFAGTGIPNIITDKYVLSALRNSQAVFSGCTFDGTSMTSNDYMMAITGSHVRFNSITASNFIDGIRYIVINTYSTVTTSSSTFTNFTNSLFDQYGIKYFIFDNNTFTNVQVLLRGSADRNIPSVINRTYMTAAWAAACNVYAVSEPQYLSSAHPCVILANQKIYDILTGEALT